MAALSQEQRMLVQTTRELAENQFVENAFTWGSEAPWENLQLLADRGFLGINFDEEYGGGGMTEYEALLLTETIGRFCPDTAYFLSDQHFLAPRTIHEFGTETAKRRYLPPVTRGEDRIAIAISEPEAGSDVRAMNTVVSEENGKFVINGEKIWVSNVPHCSASVVWTKFEDGGMGTVVVEFDAPGVEMGEHFTNMAGHHQTQFYMKGVQVPEENILTQGQEGFKKNLQALNWERIGSAASSNAFGRCALEKALEYAQQRNQFGSPIADFQGIEWKLADMAKLVEASRALTHSAAKDAVEKNCVPEPLTASLAKLFSNEMVESVVSESLQIHGANGYQRNHPLEYLYRFARGQRIAAGTDEIAKNAIAGFLKRDGIIEPA